MNVWLCPVKPRSWNIIRKKGVFGAPIRASELMRLIRHGDLLVFHVLRPTSGIVAIYQATSEVYEDYEDIWGKERYPLRVKIEPFEDVAMNHGIPVPLSYLFFNNLSKEVQIEPYLRNVWIARISKKQYERLASFRSKANCRPN